MELKKMEIITNLLVKLIWPIFILIFLVIYHSEIQSLIKRTTSLNLAGQSFSFSEKLKEPIVSISSLSKITDSSIDIKSKDLQLDAIFQTCNKYIVIHGIELSEKKVFHLLEIIKASIVCGEFMGLIVLDSKEKYIGFFEKNFFHEVVVPWDVHLNYVKTKSLTEKIQWIKVNSIFATALQYPKTRIESGEGSSISIKQNQSVSEALKLLISSKKSFIPIVDNYNRLQGVITREDLIDKLLLTLIPKED